MNSAIHLTVALLTLAVPLLAQEGEQPGQTSFIGSVLPMMLVMFVIIYFLMIRPEQKKQKTKQKMMEELKKGDRILTIGGIMGTVSNRKENSVTIKTGDGTTLEVAKTAVSSVLNKDGSEKTPATSEKK
ncbi:MAG: preprotein translocase subunit YajC [Chitinivibrionales bacterium]|nr:preprotein translocase subunit YajC [Chitinivibrionales bacterium]MBD3356614.1 preprotein translocase subunit YajC [Chitinivibrionales bacterium]